MSTVVISHVSLWGGNGFGTDTQWTATLDGVVVGEWNRNRLWAWAGAERRPTATFPLPEWKRLARAVVR